MKTQSNDHGGFLFDCTIKSRQHAIFFSVVSLNRVAYYRMTQVPQSSRKTNNSANNKRPQGETLLYTDFQKKMSLTYLRTLINSTQPRPPARMTRLRATINTRRAAGARLLSFCFPQLCPTPYSYICMWFAVLSQLHKWSSAGGQGLLSRGHTFSRDNPSSLCCY